MKLHFIALGLLMIVGISSLSAQVKVGAEAGANLSGFVGNGSSPSVKGNLQAGYQVGLTVDYESDSRWVWISGLSFVQKRGDLKLGHNYADGSQMMTYPKVETRINYLRVPLKLGYDFRIRNAFNLVPSIGVYVAYGLDAGTCELDKRNESGEVQSINWKPLHGKKEHGLDAFRRWDWGGTVGLKAVMSNHYTVAFDYSLGIMKSQTTYGLRNSTYQLSVGYRF